MSFFKYKSVVGTSLEYSLDIIENNRLYLSNYDDLNDPLEGTFLMPYGFAGCTHYYETPKIHPHYHYALQRIGIVSLTTSVDNIVIWSHYADRFKGICIEFDDQHTLKDCKKVKYTMEKSFKIENPPEEWQDNPMQHLGEISVQYKALGWEYENEYRYIKEIDPDNRETRYLNLDKDEIKGVYLGYAVPNIIGNAFERLCTEKNIPLYIAYVSPENFEVNVCPRKEYLIRLAERGISLS